MAFICDKLSDNLQRDIPSNNVWTHLETMYNLEALDEGESLPFPNDEKDFALPDAEYNILKLKKDEKTEEKKVQKGKETPKVKEIKKEEKMTRGSNANGSKEVQRRDSKDSKDNGTIESVQKHFIDCFVAVKRLSISNKDETKGKNLKEETPRANKRPTRGSLKPEDNSNGKASPITVTPTTAKRRRL